MHAAVLQRKASPPPARLRAGPAESTSGTATYPNQEVRARHGAQFLAVEHEVEIGALVHGLVEALRWITGGEGAGHARCCVG